MAAALALTLAGCSRTASQTQAPAETRREDMSWGPVEMTVSLDPAKVRCDADVLMTLRIATPSEVDVEIPPLNDRVSGFILNGSFSPDPVDQGGKTVRELHFRLTPVLSKEYRIAPFAVSYTDHSVNPPRKSWFPTRPLRIEAEPAAEKGNDIVAMLDPIHIYPSVGTVAAWGAAALLAAAVGVMAWRLLRRIRRQVRIRRMSPRERALLELSELVARDLMAHDRPKEFYLELTLIVRRYIERQHRVRAPEQTTEEFLAAAAADAARFPPPVLRKLRAFLEAADLVKFAAHRPHPAAAAQATDTAREYVQSDSAAAAESHDAGRAG